MHRVKEDALYNYAVRKLRGNIFSLMSPHIAMRRTENRFRAHGSPSSSESRIVAAGPLRDSLNHHVDVCHAIAQSPARYVASTFANYRDF
jgi:hypothetical protein